jgi:hypothetical protein
MDGRGSKEILLYNDAEAIALRDLSHQRSPAQATPPPNVLTHAASGAAGCHHARGSSDGVKGWRQSRIGTPVERRDTLALGRLYEKMGRLSIIPRYLIYIIPVAAIIAVPLVIGALLPQTNLGVRTLPLPTLSQRPRY